MAKYNNRKCWHPDNIYFDSMLEMQRYVDLKRLESAGEISDLRLQVPYVLIPEQREKSTQVYTRGANKGKPKPGKLIESACTYYADFVYKDRSGNEVVEDTKGVKTKEYRIKKKLMLYVHGIRIEEVTRDRIR